MQSENATMLQHAFMLAVKMQAKTVLLFADCLDDFVYPKPIPRGFTLLLVGRRKRWDFSATEEHSLGGRAKGFVTLPKLPLTRVAKIKSALLIAIAKEQIVLDGKILCVLSRSEHSPLDCLQFIDPAEETELLELRGSQKLSASVLPEVFQMVLTLCMELAEKGREGKPVGTTFVVGDAERVMQLSKQMIINPFKGYEEDERNLLNPALKETVREFAAIDGAFVVDGDGTVLTAGRFLGAVADTDHLPRGLGSRHIAAAGITALTDAVAFVISESSGDLRIFKDGKIVMEIEKNANR